MTNNSLPFPVGPNESPSSAAAREIHSIDPAIRDAALAYLAAIEARRNAGPSSTRPNA